MTGHAAVAVLRELILREEWADSYDLIIDSHHRKGIDPAACNDGACRRASIYANKYVDALRDAGFQILRTQQVVYPSNYPDMWQDFDPSAYGGA